jgi:8-oxo-dGTP pyrophosphatase MutT (NUDIX family)
MLVRPRAGGGLLVYLTRRSSRSRFMPDAYVFPGGTLDASDRSAAARARLYGSVDGIAEDLAVAALRELFEEAGVLIVCDRAGKPAIVDPERLALIRRELTKGVPLPTLLEREQMFLDARELVYYSNWITPEREPLRFDTHFFIATAPEGQIAIADAVEVHDGAWFEPHDALARAEREELRIMFPTRKHLERLAAHDSIASLFAHARSRNAIRPIMPFMRDGKIEFMPESEAW